MALSTAPDMSNPHPAMMRTGRVRLRPGSRFINPPLPIFSLLVVDDDSAWTSSILLISLHHTEPRLFYLHSHSRSQLRSALSFAWTARVSGHGSQLSVGITCVSPKHPQVHESFSLHRLRCEPGERGHLLL